MHAFALILPTWGWVLLIIAVGALACAAITYPLIHWLASRQFGKAIRIDGPDHAAKSGTPTMGGLGMVLVSAVAITAVMAWEQSWSTTLDVAQSAPGVAAIDANIRVLLVILFGLVLFSAMGLADDLQGLARKSGKRELGVGIKARHMLALQWFSALGLSWALVSLRPTAFPASWPLGVSVLVASFVLVGCANGVNLSDGLDGLAAGLLAIAFLAVVVLVNVALVVSLVNSDAFDTSQIEPALALTLAAPIGHLLIAAATAGACLGFLYFNRHPARVFMGNVSSMGLGALLALLSLSSGQWILLPIFGAVFVAEVLSVILQVGYFKASGGKRFFRMAPFHHHFELGGMHETKIVRRFWLAGLFAAGVALALSGPMLELVEFLGTR